MGAGLFLALSSNVSAQSVAPDLSGDGALPLLAQEIPQDPIRAAEQGLTLGDDAPFAGTGTGSPIAGIFKVLLTLALAAAAVYGVVFFIKRASRRTGPEDPFLKILASASLGPNRSAHVVSVGSRAWLLGSAESGVNLISEIEDKDILNAMFLDDSRKGAENTGNRFLDFTAMLRKLGMPVKSDAPNAENIRKRRERLKGLS
ncbi:MAG: flagellar biosynthetic protein FliO [Treponema sp.]|nr:flagellar biosynthetic protein FliO [Treponema sp.]